MKKALQGLNACSFDRDVPPNCKECPYSFHGQKCENNRTGKRCCDELKDDLLALLTSAASFTFVNGGEAE